MIERAHDCNFNLKDKLGPAFIINNSSYETQTAKYMSEHMHANIMHSISAN